MKSNIKRIQKIFHNKEILKSSSGYPYSLFSITDYNSPVSFNLINLIAKEIIKKKSFNLDIIDIIVSEADRGGGPIALEVSRLLKKPFVLANWYSEKLKGLSPVRAKVGFSGEGYIYLLGIKKGDNVLVIDDLISTGGTLIGLIKSIKDNDANIVDVVCVADKIDQNGSKKIKKDFGIDVKSIVKFSSAGNRTKILTEEKEHKYWESKKSEEYYQFNMVVPSEIVAYETLYKLLKLKDKSVLDFGCYKGESSLKILNEGAKYVLGVDSSLRSIKEANNITRKKLNFLHVDEDELIKTKIKFDVCLKTFVHPTINNKETLLKSYQKINKVLKKNGILVTLGLNPKIFLDKDNNFTYYDFNKKIKKNLKDGDEFKNNLFDSVGGKISLKDFFWEEDTLVGLMNESGFKIQRIIDLNEHSLDGDEKIFFLDVKKKIEKKYSIKWRDEWNKKLYQIIIAKKINN